MWAWRSDTAGVSDSRTLDLDREHDTIYIHSDLRASDTGNVAGADARMNKE